MYQGFTRFFDYCIQYSECIRTVMPMADVPSPCIGVCALDETGAQCRGCGRTLDEIAAWPELDDAGRRRVLERLRRRWGDRAGQDAGTMEDSR